MRRKDPHQPEASLDAARRRSLRSRAAVEGVVAALVTLSVAVSTQWSLWNASERTASQSLREELIRLAAAAATTVDPELHERLHDPAMQDTSDYARGVEPLRRFLRAAPGVTYIYTAVRDGDTVRFILDAAEPGDHDGDGIDDHARIWQEYANAEPIIFEALGSEGNPGRGVASDKPYTDRWGSFITGYAPLHDDAGHQIGVVGVDVSAQDYLADKAERRAAAATGLLPGFLFSVAVGFVVAALRRRQLVAHALLESERVRIGRLAEVARRTQNAVVVTDTRGRIEWVNAGFTRITGYTLEEVVGRIPGSFLQGADSDPDSVAEMARAIREVRPTQVEIINYSKHGARYWLRIEIEPLYDDRGAHLGFMAIESDVTQRREAERALRDSKERLEIAAQAGCIGIWDYDLATGELIWDDRMFDLYGEPPGAFAGDLAAWERRVHPDDRERVTREFADSVAGRGEFASEFRVVQPSGALRHIQAHAKVVRDDTGAPRHVVGVNIDITDRRLALEALERSEASFRVFVEQAPTATAMLDKDMRYIAASHKWIDDYRLADREILGRSHYEVFPEISDEWKEIHRRCLNGAVERRDEDCFVGVDGTLQWIAWEVSPWRDREGNIGGVLMFTSDITAKKREQEFLSQASRVARVGAWELDMITMRARWSPMAREIHEVDSDFDPTLDDALSFFPPHERERLEGAIRFAVETGKGYDLECEFITATGRPRWVRTIGDAESVAGRCVRLSGAIFDITDRKNTEIRLRESEERYALVMEGTDDAIWDWDLTTNTVFYSPRMRRMLSIGDDQEASSPELWLRRIEPRQRVQFETDLTLHIEGATSALHTELVLCAEDGQRVWTLCRARAVRDENGKAVRLVGALTDISELKDAQERLRQLTLHDRLTGLPNRVFLTERLRQAAARARQGSAKTFTLLFFDFDRFKMINDALGHAVGDQLLISVAQRFRASLRACDVAARFGGDEFVVLLDGSDEAEGNAIAERLVDIFAAPHDLDGHEVVSTASVGLATWSPEYGAVEDLLRDADAALQVAKAQGKNRVQCFDTTMRQRLMRHHEVETLLRTTIPEDEFAAAYQPVVSLESGEIAGFEALLRWPGAPLGEILPDEFVPVAEETGDIVRLGEWILRTACRTLRGWIDEFGEKRAPWISVNLSKRQLSQPGLIDLIKSVLRETGVPASLLKLEITESTIMDPRHDHIEAMRRIRALGVGLAMDDFGSGYSSLSCLQRFPIETLKIDRGFVVNLTTQRQFAAVMQSIVLLAHHMDLTIVAEGVETREQVAQLQSIGCGYAQGFYFAKPLHAEHALAMLRHGADGLIAA